MNWSFNFKIFFQGILGTEILGLPVFSYAAKWRYNVVFMNFVCISLLFFFFKDL